VQGFVFESIFFLLHFFFHSTGHVVVAEAAREGKVDLSLVSVDSTTVRAHHDAAGMLVDEDLMHALEKAAREQETTRQKGASRRNRTDRTSADASDGDASSA